MFVVVEDGSLISHIVTAETVTRILTLVPRALALSLAALAAVMCCWVPSSAQGLVRLGVEMPPMELNICPTLAAATAQAALSREFGKQDHRSADQLPYIYHQCGRMEIAVRPRYVESSISPFETWVIAFKKASDKTFEITYGGDGTGYARRKVIVPWVIEQQIVRYYRASYRHPNGNWYTAWVEVPDEPVLLKLLAEEGRL